MPGNLGDPLVVYCNGPGRVTSKIAAGKAVKLGYGNVYWHKEGLKGWKAAYYTIETVLVKGQPLPGCPFIQ